MGRQLPVARKARPGALPTGQAETTDQVSFGASAKGRAVPSFDQNSFERGVCISCATPRNAIKGVEVCYLREERFSPSQSAGGNTDRETSMRAIGLVLLSIAIMALLLTDADAKRRGSQAAGAGRSWCATYPGKGISDNCSYATEQQCLAQVWGLGGFCRPNPFPGSAYGSGYTLSSAPPRQTRGGY